jgi:hypothetical protein
MLGWLLLSSAPAGAAPPADDQRLQRLREASTRASAYADSLTGLRARTDSLVWYLEDLEKDLRICGIRAAATADSLALRLEFMGYRLQWAIEDRPRWYQRPGVAFLGGAVAALLLLAQVLRLSF